MNRAECRFCGKQQPTNVFYDTSQVAGDQAAETYAQAAQQRANGAAGTDMRKTSMLTPGMEQKGKMARDRAGPAAARRHYWRGAQLGLGFSSQPGCAS